jgi:hypothetical protein
VDPLYTSVRIQTQGAKPIWIHPDPDLVQTLEVKFYTKNILQVIGPKTNLRRYLQINFERQENQVYLLILVNVHAPGSGFAFI